MMKRADAVLTADSGASLVPLSLVQPATSFVWPVAILVQPATSFMQPAATIVQPAATLVRSATVLVQPAATPGEGLLSPVAGRFAGCGLQKSRRGPGFHRAAGRRALR